MTTPSRWDAERARKVGRAPTKVPSCSRCGATGVLDPCRRCATPEELAKYPLLSPERPT